MMGPMMKKAFAAGVIALVAVLACANWPTEALPTGVNADRVVVMKSGRELVLFRDSKVLKRYRISLGQTPVGPKKRAGDKKTPEGVYRITEHKRDSAYHLALRISYPGANEIQQAKAAGVNPGSDIMVHGIRNGLGFLGRLHRLVDWTAGCIAVTNPEIQEILSAVPVGTVIEIRE
jgi:murein L,D-transpeptidase YafK